MAKCLEELKISKQVVSFLGHDFSLGFIPLGQSIPLIQAYQEMIKLEKNQASAQKLLMAKVKMVSDFCSFIYPHMDENYILKHGQLKELDDFFVQLIQCVLQELLALNQSEKQTESSKKKRCLGSRALIYFALFLAVWKSMSYIIIT